ncbi:MAG: TAXI family TRAP transporter solute-binding subunit [Candidatus Hodarchaeota archaeon]
MNIKRRVAGGGFIMIIVITTLFLLAFLVPEGKAAEAVEHEEFKIHMHGAVPGSSGQIITFGWADLINKNSDWLKVTVSEEAGPGAAAPLMVSMPQKKKNTVMFVLEGQPQGWSLGKPPLTPKKAYTSWTIIAKTINVPYGILTFDPEIKTLYDMAGKKFSNLGRRTTCAMAMDNILDAVGLKTKVKIDYLDPVSGKDAFLSGLVQTVILPLSNDGPNWNKFPYFEEIMSSRDTYFVDMTKEAIEKGFAKYAWPHFPLLHVPKGAYGPTQEAFWTYYTGNLYTADKDMPEEVVYEMLRIMYEQMDSFKNYHIMAKSMSRETMGMVPVTEDQKHPGAIKFYKEKGIKYGMSSK